MQIKVISNENQIYQRQKLLGEGAFGKAYLVRNKKTQELLVIKEINLEHMSKTERDQTIKEAQILRNLNHPNIVELMQFYITKQNKLKMVMEYAECGDISKAISSRKKNKQHYNEGHILDWFTQLCLAIKHVHDRKILHRDIKGQNVFITKTNTLKLGDFGIARVLNKTVDKARTVVGTPYYLSPQIIQNKPYSFKSDIWSMGVVLYQLCAFHPPFTANSLQFLALKIVKGSYTPIENYSKQLKSLIAQMLSLNPDKRPSVNQILKKSVIQNRIRNFLTDSKHNNEFSHTVLHNQKVQIFANKLVQQQQKQNSRQSTAAQSQISRIQQQRAKLKQQQIKLQEKKESQKRKRFEDQCRRKQDDRRRQEQDKKIKDKQRMQGEEQRKRWIMQEKKKELRKKKEQAQFQSQIKKQQLMHKNYEQDEKQRKAQQKLKKLKKQQENKRKTNQLNQFARQQYFENLQIRKRAEQRAKQQRDGYYQPYVAKPNDSYKPERDRQQPQQKKPQVAQNYHYNNRPVSKGNSREKPTQDLLLDKKSKSSLIGPQEDLLNVYQNPNFKGKKPTKQRQYSRPGTSSRQNKQEKKANYDSAKEKTRNDDCKNIKDKQKDHRDGQQNIKEQQVTIRGAKWSKRQTPQKIVKQQQQSPYLKQQQFSPQKEAQTEIWDSGKLFIDEKQKNNFNEYVVQLQGILDNVNKNIQGVETSPQTKEPCKKCPLMEIPVVEEVVFRDDDDELSFSLTAKNNTTSQRKQEQQLMEQQVDLDYFSDYSKLEALRMQLEEVFGTSKFIQLYRIFQKQMNDKGLQGFDLTKIISSLDSKQFDSKLITENMSKVMILIVMEQKANSL